MGIKTVFHELKAKVTSSRLFKAMFTEAHDVIPKIMSHKIKSIETIHGHGVSVGCIRQTNFVEGSPYKYMKHRIDDIDEANHVCKYTLFEGDVLGNKIEKVHYELKLEDNDDGECVVKIKSEFHSKGHHELEEDDIKEGKEQIELMYKACEEYLLANPHVCA